MLGRKCCIGLHIVVQVYLMKWLVSVTLNLKLSHNGCTVANVTVHRATWLNPNVQISAVHLVNHSVAVTVRQTCTRHTELSLSILLRNILSGLHGNTGSPADYSFLFLTLLMYFTLRWVWGRCGWCWCCCFCWGDLGKWGVALNCHRGNQLSVREIRINMSSAESFFTLIWVRQSKCIIELLGTGLLLTAWEHPFKSTCRLTVASCHSYPSQQPISYICFPSDLRDKHEEWFDWHHSYSELAGCPGDTI